MPCFPLYLATKLCSVAQADDNQSRQESRVTAAHSNIYYQIKQKTEEPAEMKRVFDRSASQFNGRRQLKRVAVFFHHLKNET